MTDHEAMEPEEEAPEAHETEATHARGESPPPEPPRLEAHPTPPVPQAAARSPQVRTPLLAGIFSVFPGLGNVYNGLYLRGATFFLLFFGLIALAHDTRPPEAVLLVFTIIFVWLFNIFDAYRQATFINFGYGPEPDWPDKPRTTNWGSGGLVAGIAVFLLGLYGFLREQFEIDFTLIADYWYVWFMGFGLFLIYQWWRQSRPQATEDDI